MIKTDFEYHLVFRSVSLLFMEEKGEVLFKESFFASFQSQTSLKEVENEERMHFGTLF